MTPAELKEFVWTNGLNECVERMNNQKFKVLLAPSELKDPNAGYRCWIGEVGASYYTVVAVGPSPLAALRTAVCEMSR